MNAIDVRRFNAHVVARLRARAGERERKHAATYARDFTREEMRAWIDHHPVVAVERRR